MRTIQRQISLEPMTSRLPSVWPAYFTEEISGRTETRLYFFDDNSLRDREWYHTSNWGMIPTNIVLNHNPNELGEDERPQSAETYSIINGCHCYGGNYRTCTGCSTSGKSSYDRLNFSGDCDCCISGDGCSFVISFENLSKWYHFFTEYYNLLKQYSHCDRVYTSAEDYYNYESLTKYADQMKYGTDKQTYIDLDEEFAKKGGRVEVQIYNKDTAKYSAITPTQAHDEFKGDRMTMTDVYDIGFFKWICNNIVPSFTIPMKYRNYWNRDTLYYPDVIKWLAWLGQRARYEEVFSASTSYDVDRWDCKNHEGIDCCDCDEYFNRGGARIYSAMTDWYNGVQKVINTNSEIISSSTSCFTPTIIMPIELQLSIDDLGEYSIFSKDYELGKDYRVARYGDTENTHGGTVATMNGRSIYLDKNGWGYAFDEDCMEKYVSSCRTCGYVGVFFDVCPKCGGKNIEQITYMSDDNPTAFSAWTSYTDRYRCHDYCCSGDSDGCFSDETYNNRNDFEVSAVTYYTYNENNVKFNSSAATSGDALTDLRSQLAKKYSITSGETGWMLINGGLYEIDKAEYGKYYSGNTYLSGATFLVFREEGTDTPYTFINGKKVFAEFYPLTNKYYFPFFTVRERERGKFNINDYITYDRIYNPSSAISYVRYDGNTYYVSADTMIINGYESYTISGYAMSDNNEMLYCLSGSDKVYYDGYGTQEYPNSSADSSSVTVSYTGDVTLYSVDEITGRTVSKVSDLRLFNVLTDDIGNNIEGIYNYHTDGILNHQPPEGTELELIFQVGNTANIQRFSQTEDDIDKLTGNTNYFVGDIITEMDFYYKDFSDEQVKDTLTKVSLSSDDLVHIDYVECKYDEQTSSVTTTNKSTSAQCPCYTSLSAITFATSAKTSLESGGTLCYDDIFCDMTYYKGATLSRRYGSTYNLASFDRDEPYQNHGVEYKETVRFVKTNWEYYLQKPSNSGSTLPTLENSPCNHSISYPVYVYVLTQDLERVDESQYDSEYAVPMANFKANINVFTSCTEDTYSHNYSGDMVTHNGLEVFPVYREEYRFGISTLENVDSDIYIDRGINAAFEKHLKLGEVTSLEALEQYGNGYFKIMES